VVVANEYDVLPIELFRVLEALGMVASSTTGTKPTGIAECTTAGLGLQVKQKVPIELRVPKLRCKASRVKV